MNQKLPCPRCGKKFRNPQGLASHLFRTHGVPGKSHRTKAMRKEALNEQKVVYGEAQIAYVCGYVQAWIENFAVTSGLSAGAIAAGVARFLHRQASRKILGA